MSFKPSLQPGAIVHSANNANFWYPMQWLQLHAPFGARPFGDRMSTLSSIGLGALGRPRSCNSFRTRGFKSRMYANSITSAYFGSSYQCCPGYCILRGYRLSWLSNEPWGDQWVLPPRIRDHNPTYCFCTMTTMALPDGVEPSLLGLERPRTNPCWQLIGQPRPSVENDQG